MYYWVGFHFFQSVPPFLHFHLQLLSKKLLLLFFQCFYLLFLHLITCSSLADFLWKRAYLDFLLVKDTFKSFINLFLLFIEYFTKCANILMGYKKGFRTINKHNRANHSSIYFCCSLNISQSAPIFWWDIKKGLGPSTNITESSICDG